MPAAVLTGTATLAVMFTGDPDLGFTVAPGVKLQVALGMDVLHETVTLWLKCSHVKQTHWPERAL